MLFILGKSKFELGTMVATRGVNEEMDRNPEFHDFVNKSFERHINGDWGDICEEDKQSNDEALNNHGSLYSKYIFNGDISIFIITEWDRSATTILFPEEY